MDTTEFCPLSREAIWQLLGSFSADCPDTVQDERRRLPRWPFPGTVELWLPDEDGLQHALATCQNLSFGGVGILIDQELNPGEQLAIAIHQPAMSLHGQAIVRHCRPTDEEYYVGLEFVFEAA